MLAWIWAKPLGIGMGVLDLRSLSAIFGSLTVPVAFLAGRELSSRRAGLIAAAFVALNPFLVWYSQEARAYALLVFLITLGLYLFARALRSGSARNLLSWSVVSILALSSHYFAAFVVIPEALWLIAVVRPRLRAVAATALVGAAGVALLPLAILQEGAGHPDAFTAIPLFTRTWMALANFASSYSPDHRQGHTPIGTVQVAASCAAAGVAVAAALIVVRRGSGAERRAALMSLSIGVAAVAIPAGLALVGDDYLDSRNVIGAVAPLLVAGAIALGATGSRRAGPIVATGVCAIFAFVLVAVSLNPQLQRRDWRGLASAIGPTVTKRVVIAPKTARWPLVYYLHARPLGPVRKQPALTRQLDLVTSRPHVMAPKAYSRLEMRPVAGDLWLWRYRFARPRPINPRTVADHRWILQPAAGLVTGSFHAGHRRRSAGGSGHA